MTNRAKADGDLLQPAPTTKGRGVKRISPPLVYAFIFYCLSETKHDLAKAPASSLLSGAGLFITYDPFVLHTDKRVEDPVKPHVNKHFYTKLSHQPSAHRDFFKDYLSGDF